MPYVITEPCSTTCDTGCVDACPVDAIHGPLPLHELREITAEERERRVPRLQLFIDPESCICCGACEPECPVNAIFDEDDLPPAMERYRDINAEFFRDRRAGQ